MLVFPTDDARGDQRDFATRGLDTYAPFDFGRAARLPDGSEAMVSFSLAFVTHAAMPDAAFFACQQHAPQYFWKPAYQRHANGACAVVEVVMAADDPARFADFFGRLVEPRRVVKDGTGVRIALDGAAMTVLGSEALRAWCPDVRMPRSPAFVGYAVAVEDLARVEAILRGADLSYRRRAGVLQVAPADAFGAVIEFRAAS